VEKATRTGIQNLVTEKISGMNVRSSWEANFARVSQLYKIEIEFEPRVFTFPVKRGTKGYTPDFYLTKTEEWIEIKGFLDDKSKIKLKRFKRYYPEEFAKLTMVISKYSTAAKSFVEEIEVPQIIYYEDIRDFYADKIYNWEGK
jgi:hypothetical protein